MAMWGGNYWAARDREADAKAWLETEFGTNWKAQHGLVQHPRWPDEANYMLCSKCQKHCAYYEGSKSHIQSQEHRKKVPQPLCAPVRAAAKPVAVPLPPAEEPVAVPAPPVVVTPPPGLNSEEAAIEGLGAALADMLSLDSSSSSSNSDLLAGLPEAVQYQTVVDVFLHWTPELQSRFIRCVSDQVPAWRSFFVRGRSS